jgi:hypothetical protein
MPALTMRFPCVVAHDSATASDVLLVCYTSKVGRIYAPSISADVVDFMAFGYRADV